MTWLWMILQDGRVVGGRYPLAMLLERIKVLDDNPDIARDWWLA